MGDPFQGATRYKIMQDAAAASGDGQPLLTDGMSTAGLQVLIAGGAATVNFEVSVNGSTWVAARAYNPATGAVATTATASGVWIIPCAGRSQVRARISGHGGAGVTVTVAGLASEESSADACAAVAAVDVTDRAGRLLGAVSGTVTANQGTAGAAAWPVSLPVIASGTLVSPTGGSKTVAATGTAEALVATTTKRTMLFVRAKTANTNKVYFGDSTVDKTTSQQVVLAAGESVSVAAPAGACIDIGQFYIDVDTNGEGVDFLYI